MISESVVRDLSHGLRLLARNPGSTLLAVVALAAGIGINTAVYTGYKAMVARPLDAHDPSTMVNLALKRGLATRSGRSAIRTTKCCAAPCTR